MNRRSLYFLHIPKTAGTTFGEYLDRQFERAKVLPFRTWNQLLAATPDREIARSPGLLCGSALVRGHFGFAAMLELPIRTDVVTILRDPVERVVSQFLHLQRDAHTNNWAPAGVLDGLSEVTDINQSVAARTLLQDVQLRYLASDVDVRRAWLRTPAASRSDWYFDSVPAFHATSTRTRRQSLRLAIRRLDRMAVVGVQDMLQETMLVAAHRLRLAPAISLPGLMSAPVSPRRTKDLDRYKAVVGPITTGDALLYSVARTRLINDYTNVARQLLRRADLSVRDLLMARRVVNDELFGVLQDRAHEWAA